MKLLCQKVKSTPFKKGVFFLGFIVIMYLFFVMIDRTFFYVDRNTELRKVEKNKYKKRVSEQNVNKLENGDIILRRGYGMFSDMISRMFCSPENDYTHCGILYKENEQWYVIHSLSSQVSDFEGVQSQSLKTFLKHSQPEKIMVVRSRASKQDRENIVLWAKIYSEKKTPFDKMGIIDDNSQLYCSELVWQILANDLKIISLPEEKNQRKKIFYSMEKLYDGTYFDVVFKE